MKKIYLLMCATLLFFGLSYGQASAELLRTYDFEIPELAGGPPAFLYDDFTNETFWSTAGVTGIWKPRVSPDTAGPYFNSIPSGEQVAATTQGDLWSNTGLIIDAGYIYTISVSVGNSANDSRNFITNFFFRATTADFAEIARYDNVGTKVEPDEGDWLQFAFSFNSDAWANEELIIGLNAEAATGIIGFDDLTIERTVAAVPEPATMLLLGFGLIGLAGLGRKKFFKK